MGLALRASYLHTYIIGHYNASVKITAKISITSRAARLVMPAEAYPCTSDKMHLVFNAYYYTVHLDRVNLFDILASTY